MKKNKILFSSVIIITFAVVITALFFHLNNKKTGAFKLYAVVFEDADKGISRIIEVQLANVYYWGNLMLEVLPKNNGDEFCFVEKNKFSGYYKSLSELNFNVKRNISEKKEGAVFLCDTIPNYFERENLNDTILDDVLYKRFSVRNDIEYSVFYISEKVDLPYSLNKRAEKDYKGTITRVDTYQKDKDLFVSLRLVPNDTIPRKFYDKLKNN